MRISVVLSVFLLLPAVCFCATVYVDGANTTGPWDGTKVYPYPTIQQGLDGALAGDTVLVFPGLYVENIDFKGNAVTLISEEGPAYTVIDGNKTGSVVRFTSGEGNDSVIEGFTLTNGHGTRETVLVQPGTYTENIDFSGKAIRLRSRGGYDVTTIDGGGLGSVVTFAGGEGSDSVLEGFTVMNGSAGR